MKATVRYAALLTITLLTITPTLAFAGSADLHEGSKAMGINYFLQSGEYPSGLDGKYFLSADTAVIGELKFSSTSNDFNSDNYTYKFESDSIILSGGLRNYFYKGEVNIFGDGQLLLGYGKTKSLNKTGSAESGYETSDYNVGLIVEIGAEYFLTPAISLSAKMGIQYIYTRGKSTTKNSGGYSDTSKYKQTDLSNSETLLSLNAYW